MTFQLTAYQSGTVPPNQKKVLTSKRKAGQLGFESTRHSKCVGCARSGAVDQSVKQKFKPSLVSNFIFQRQMCCFFFGVRLNNLKVWRLESQLKTIFL
jgi:hypothetical protein